MDPCFLAWGLGYPVSFPTHTFLFIWNILSAHVTQNTKNNPLFFFKWFHYNHEFYIAYFGRDKIVDFHWNSSDPWTIVSVSDDGESTGGGGTLQVRVFLVILQTVVNWQDKSELCFHLQLELLNLYVSLVLYSIWILFCSYNFICSDMAHEWFDLPPRGGSSPRTGEFQGSLGQLHSEELKSCDYLWNPIQCKLRVGVLVS